MTTVIQILLIVIVFFFLHKMDKGSPKVTDSEETRNEKITNKYLKFVKKQFANELFKQDQIKLYFLNRGKTEFFELKGDWLGLDEKLQIKICVCLKEKIETTNDQQEREEIASALGLLLEPREMVKDRLRNIMIIDGFSEIVKEHQGEILDVSKLPFKKKDVFNAFCEEYKLEKNEERKSAIINWCRHSCSLPR